MVRQAHHERPLILSLSKDVGSVVSVLIVGLYVARRDHHGTIALLMRIAIVGAGGVGGYFGGRLAAAGSDVTFVARGAHLEAMRARGLRLESPNGNLHVHRVKATDDPATIGPVDAVLFTVKLYDVETAAAKLPPLIGPDTVVVPFQNGVDAVAMLKSAVGPSHVGAGVAYVASVVAEPGLIRHTAMDHLIFGELDGTRSPRFEHLLRACEAAGFQATLSDHIEVDIWSKFVRLAVFSGVTAVTRTPIGPLRDDPDLWALFQAAILEGVAVARAKGIALPASIFDEIGSMARSLPPQAKSSMLEDLERGRPLELPWLSGALVRIGREVDVETPIHRFIATVLKPHVTGHPKP
jgi:2-dehydropantoate 2-reductase